VLKFFIVDIFWEFFIRYIDILSLFLCYPKVKIKCYHY